MSLLTYTSRYVDLFAMSVDRGSSLSRRMNESRQENQEETGGKKIEINKQNKINPT